MREKRKRNGGRTEGQRVCVREFEGKREMGGGKRERDKRETERDRERRRETERDGDRERLWVREIGLQGVFTLYPQCSHELDMTITSPKKGMLVTNMRVSQSAPQAWQLPGKVITWRG